MFYLYQGLIELNLYAETKMCFWSITTEQTFPDLQYWDVTLPKKVESKISLHPKHSLKCWGVPNKRRPAPLWPVHHFWQRGWLCCNTYVPVAASPQLSLPGGCLSMPSIWLLWLSTAHILPRQNSTLKLSAGAKPFTSRWMLTETSEGKKK